VFDEPSGGGRSSASAATDDATERRKLRPTDGGAGSLGRQLFHGFWEVMILSLPVHLYLLAFTGSPVAERTAAVFAYPAAIAAAGVLRGGHVSVGDPWPDHLGWGVPVRVLAYNLGIAAGVELGVVVIVGVHWVAGAAVAAVVPTLAVAAVPRTTALVDRLRRGR
jgi:predicted MFS family arabinose efflux permease